MTHAPDREYWWIRLDDTVKVVEVEFKTYEDGRRPIRIWAPGVELSLRPVDVVMLQRVPHPQETASEVVSTLAARIVRTLDAMADRFDEYAEHEPLIAQAKERYTALRRQGRDFTTSSEIARSELVAALIAQLALGPTVDEGGAKPAGLTG